MRLHAPESAAVYARISHDPSGARSGVRRQEEDCLAEAQRRGWSVAQVYVDDDRSAYSTRKPRPEYDRLLRDIQLGMRDGVMIWKLDRLHRQPRELEEFILLCDRHRVALATVTGDVDLATSQGRLLARAWGAFAAHESEVKGERLARASLDRARQGIVHVAARPYGYKRGGLAVQPDEAKVIKEAAKRLLCGDSIRGICVDYNRRDIPTTKGGLWNPSSLRRVLNNPRIAGLSTYHGDVVGKGNWPMIISRPRSERLRALLGDPNRLHNPGATSAYVLKALLRCGRCGERLASSRKRGQRRYSCARNPGRKGCGQVSIPADQVEAFVIEQAYERLDSEAFAAAVQREHISNLQWRKAKSVQDAGERRLVRMARDYATGSLTRLEWMAARPTLIERVEASKAALMRDRAVMAVAEYTGNAHRLRIVWEGFPANRRHTILAAVIKEAMVWPARTTRPRSVSERLLIWWHGEPRPHAPSRVARQGLAERRAAGEFDGCAAVGCPEPHRSNGYCNLHLQRLRKRGAVGAAGRKRLAPYRGAICLTAGCDQLARSGGRCDPHYRAWRRADPSSPRCSVADCGRAVDTAGLCWRHYMRMRRARSIIGRVQVL